MDDRIHTKEGVSLILASPIMVSNMSMPTRLVLYHDTHTSQFVVHQEHLTTEHPDRNDSCKFVHHSFQNGSYFPYKCASRPSATISEYEARYHAEHDYKERTRQFLNIR